MTKEQARKLKELLNVVGIHREQAMIMLETGRFTHREMRGVCEAIERAGNDVREFAETNFKVD